MSNAALRLCVPLKPGREHLVFRAGDPCIGRVSHLTADIELRTLAMGGLLADVPALRAAVSGRYDHAVWRGRVAQLGGGWQRAVTSRADARSVHQICRRDRSAFASGWEMGRHGLHDLRAAHAILARTPRDLVRSAWVHAQPVGAQILAGHAVMLRWLRPVIASPWQPAFPLWLALAGVWQEMFRWPRPERVARFGVAAPFSVRWGGGFQPGLWRVSEWRVPWGEGMDRYGWGGPWWPPPPPPLPYVGCYPPPRSGVLALIDWLAPDRRHLRFVCRHVRQVPRLRSYIVIHDIEVLRLPDMTPIHASRLELSLDADAWAWSFRAQLVGREAREAVMPAPDGTPVTLEVNINGFVWHVLVEDWREDRTHGKRGISCSGRGLSALLAAPYRAPGSGVNTDGMTLQQLVEAHVPVDSGFMVTWSAPNWPLPAGAWSWQWLTPIQAMHAIAQGVGLVLVPSMAGKSLRVQPRYPVLPWDFASASPDLVIPDSGLLSLSRRHSVATQANAVYVHGTEVGGILAWIRRTGTAGERLAQTQSHALITHADAARSLGSRILAGQHRQPEVRDVTTTLGTMFPLAQIGQLLRVEDGAVTDLGIINAVQVEAVRDLATVSVRQTLTIGEDTPNVWAAFRRILPESPLLAGQIASAHPDGTVTVSLIGGGQIRVRGDGSVGQSVYVRDGRIDGDAPALSGIVIEI